MKKLNKDPIAPLKQARTFNGKIDALINYLKIKTVYCHIDEKLSKPPTSPKRKFKVKSIYIRTGSLSYITSFMNTTWPYLDVELEKLVESNTGYYNIRKTLLDCKSKCFREREKYDMSDEYQFEAIYALSLVSENKEFPALFENVVFKKEHLLEMREHCKVRSSFLRRLYNYLDEKLTSFINIPEIRNSPYEWDSDKSDLEIAEFLYALKLSGRLKIKEGNESQFREQFYHFFGLEDKNFNKKTNAIRRRANRPILLNSLAKALESVH